MKDIIFADAQTVRQPKNGLKVVDQLLQDHKQGGMERPDMWTRDCPDGHWKFWLEKTSIGLPTIEIQTLLIGEDTYWCVIFSKNSAERFVHIIRYKEDKNDSEQFLANASNTVLGEGNDKRTVAEARRLQGFLTETQLPFRRDLPMSAAYAKLTNEQKQLALVNKLQYDYAYKWLRSTSVADILDGLTFSPVQVDVQRYAFNNKGYVINAENIYAAGTYCHEVIIFDYELNECWYVYDSEQNQFLKYDWNYHFWSGMIHSVKKKYSMKLFCKQGQAAIAGLNPLTNKLVAFGDGTSLDGETITGGEVFKTMYGTDNYNQLPIERPAEWPFAFEDWMIKAVPSTFSPNHL